MNTTFNIRYLSTEEKIQNALFSLLRFRKYNDIAIKELCYEAGINRSSFYAHYQDINDLMIQTEARLSKEITKIFDPSKKWTEEVFVELFEFIFKNRVFYSSYLATNEQTFMEKNDFTKFVDIVNHNVTNIGINSNDKIYHMAFFAGGLKALCKSWLNRNCPETPQQLAKILTNEYKMNMKYYE